MHYGLDVVAVARHYSAPRIVHCNPETNMGGREEGVYTILYSVYSVNSVNGAYYTVLYSI